MGELNIYQKASAGQKFKPRHETWNAFIEAAEANQRRNDAGDQGELNLRYDETNRVRGKNETGAGLTKGSIVGVDAPIFDPSVHPNTFDQTVGFEFVTPSLPDHQRAFGVLLEDIPAEGIGRVAVGGLVWCQVALSAGVTSAIPADSNTSYMVANDEGYPIVWRPAAGVIEWCLVLLSAPHETALTVVEVYDAMKAVGEPVSGDGSCVFPGRVLDFQTPNCAGGSWDTGASCWIFPVDDPTGSIPNRSRFIAKDEGTLDIGGDERTLYEIARGSPTGIVRFQLTENKAYGAHADGVLLDWNGSSYDTGAAITVTDSFGIWGAAFSGAQGFGVSRADRPTEGGMDSFEILYIEAKPSSFIGKCTGNYSLGAVTVDPVQYDFGGGVTTAETGHALNGQVLPAVTVVAEDATGTDEAFDFLVVGDIVQLDYYAPRDKYYITGLIQAEAILFEAQLSGALQAGSGTATLTTLDAITDGPFNRSRAVGPNPTILNTFGLAGEDGDQALVRRTNSYVAPTTNVYTLIQVKHKEISVVTDNIVSGTDLKEIKRDCAVMYHTDTYEELNSLPIGGIGGSWVASAQFGVNQVVDVGTALIRDTVNVLGSDTASVGVLGQCIRTDIQNISSSEHTIHVSHADGPPITQTTDDAGTTDTDIPVTFGYDSCGHVNAIDWMSPCHWFEKWLAAKFNAKFALTGQKYALVFEITSDYPNPDITCDVVKLDDCPT